MLAMDVIKPAQGEWAAPIGFSSKKDGPYCFFVDYLKHHEVRRPDLYPIRRTDKCIDPMGDAMIFLTWEMNIRYCLLRIS